MRRALLLVGVLIAWDLSSQEVKINTNLVYKVNMPLKKAAKVPVLVMLHGYRSNENDLNDICRSQDERFMSFSLRGPVALANEGEFGWFKLDRDDKGQLKYDYKEVMEARKKIMSFISNACKEYKLDSSQVFIMGFSQGAMMSFDIAFTEANKVKGVLPLSGLLMKESREKKIKDADLMKVNFFIGHGSEDNLIKASFAEEASEFLKTKKVPVIYKSYPMPHSICGNELNDIKEFMRKNLKPDKENKSGSK